ncbi:MAG: hypothetical protein NTX50_09675 [Candidatus Sumerlaeota bacterium]|nr:hypothetical protein [Candidatus Sumerlaeota bacterium]
MAGVNCLNPISSMHSLTDSGTFSGIGMSILDGKIPYRDIWEQKPPMTFYINAFALKAGGRTFTSIHDCERLFSLLRAVLFFLILLHAFDSALLALIATAFLLLHFNQAAVFQWGNLTEEYGTIFVLAGIVFAVLARSKSSEFRVPSSESQAPVPSSEFRVPSSETLVPSSEFRVPSLEAPVPSSEPQDTSSEFRVPSSESQVLSSEPPIPNPESPAPTTGPCPLTPDPCPSPRFPLCVLSGFFFALAAFTKEPFLLSSIPWFFFILFQRANSWKTRVVRAGCFIGGALIPALFFVLYLAAHGVLGDWYDTVTFSVSYTSRYSGNTSTWAKLKSNAQPVLEKVIGVSNVRLSPSGIPPKPGETIEKAFGIAYVKGKVTRLTMTPLICAALGLIGALFYPFVKKYHGFPLAAAAAFFFDYVGTALSGRSLGHYYMQLVPSYILLGACGAALLMDLAERLHLWRFWILALAVASIYFWDRGALEQWRNELNAEYKNVTISPMGQYIRDNSEEDDQIWSPYGHASRFYIEAGRACAVRFPNLSDMVVVDTWKNTAKQKIDALKEELKAKPPKFIVIEDYGTLMKYGLMAWIEANYIKTPIQEHGGYNMAHLWARRSDTDASGNFRRRTRSQTAQDQEFIKSRTRPGETPMVLSGPDGAENTSASQWLKRLKEGFDGSIFLDVSDAMRMGTAGSECAGALVSGYRLIEKSPDENIILFRGRLGPAAPGAATSSTSALSATGACLPPAPKRPALAHIWLTEPFVFSADGKFLGLRKRWTQKVMLPPSFTIEFIVKPAKQQVPFAHILGNHPGVNGREGFVIQQVGSNVNQYIFSYGDGAQFYNSVQFSLKPEVWSFVTLTVDRQKVDCYVNGALVSSRMERSAIKNSELPLAVGDWFRGDRPFAGIVREVRITAGAASAAEIQQLWAGRKTN